jgi:hypothetical protein
MEAAILIEAASAPTGPQNAIQGLIIHIKPAAGEQQQSCVGMTFLSAQTASVFRGAGTASLACWTLVQGPARSSGDARPLK